MEKESKIITIIKIVGVLAVIGAVIISYKIFEKRYNSKQISLEAQMKELRIKR
jgi:hypothetical protein